MSFLDHLRMLKIFVHLLINPERTDLIFQAVNILTNNRNEIRIRNMEQNLLSHPEFKALFEEQYFPQTPDLVMLKNCEPGTFGRAVYQHMNKNNLDFSIWPEAKTDRTIHYMTTRSYLDHDLWHTLLGYGIDVSDELAIQGFNVAQFESPLAIMLIAGGLLKMLVKNPVHAVETFKKVNDGYNLGRQSRFLLGVRLHDYFTLPLNEVRALCALPISS